MSNDNKNVGIKYTLRMRAMHWIMAAITLGLLASGLYMTDLSWEMPAKGTWYFVHKSFGMIVIPLVILRLVFRFTNQIPALPKNIKTTEQVLAKFGTVLLYWFLLVVPMSGYMMSITAGHPVMVFGLPIPSILDKNEALASFFHSIHVQIWYFFIAMILLHIASSLKHLWYDKVNLFARMW